VISCGPSARSLVLCIHYAWRLRLEVGVAPGPYAYRTRPGGEATNSWLRVSGTTMFPSEYVPLVAIASALSMCLSSCFSLPSHPSLIQPSNNHRPPSRIPHYLSQRVYQLYHFGSSRAQYRATTWPPLSALPTHPFPSRAKGQPASAPTFPFRSGPARPS
jgi:hypothetical protein